MPLKYILKYKLSQDHLELFFAAIRSVVDEKRHPGRKRKLSKPDRHSLCGE